MVAIATTASPVKLESIVSTCTNTEIRKLFVHESEDEVIISGKVRCFYFRQLALETVRRYADGRRIVDHILVSRES